MNTFCFFEKACIDLHTSYLEVMLPLFYTYYSGQWVSYVIYFVYVLMNVLLDFIIVFIQNVDGYS